MHRLLLLTLATGLGLNGAMVATAADQTDGDAELNPIHDRAPEVSYPARRSNSRLSRLLIREQPRVYLPGRLLMGQDNPLMIKAPAGAQVTLLISAASKGYVLPDATPLSVGPDFQKIEGLVPANGVLQLAIPVPAAEDGVEGAILYIDGYLTQDDGLETPSQYQRLVWMDAAGQPTRDNHLVIAKSSEGKGPMIMPSIPGLPSQLLNTIGQKRRDDDAAQPEVGTPLMSPGLPSNNPFVNPTGNVPSGAGY